VAVPAGSRKGGRQRIAAGAATSACRARRGAPPRPAGRARGRHPDRRARRGL